MVPLEDTDAADTPAPVLKPEEPRTAPTAESVALAVTEPVLTVPTVDRLATVTLPADVNPDAPTTTANDDREPLDVREPTAAEVDEMLAAVTTPLVEIPPLPM